ncbi:MAG: DUF1841 family protein [Gammaproteobacteria bacterium]|nr:MAG: DUF1841 family protein [Gammaproteobacteria bacterium]
MYQSRDEIRQVYFKVWQKMQNQSVLEPLEAIIADVIKLHPEYHSMLETGETAKQKEFSPEDGQTNPFLHMGMHITLREQAGGDRPAGILDIYQKLVQQKGIHETEHAMMECLGQTLWNAQRHDAMPDENAYLACLRQL